MKLLSRLRLQFIHLNGHKFRHGFSETVHPTCPCGTDLETNEHFLLRCNCFSNQGSELFDYLDRLDPSFSTLSTKEKATSLLYGSLSNSSSLHKEAIKLAKNMCFLNYKRNRMNHQNISVAVKCHRDNKKQKNWTSL